MPLQAETLINQTCGATRCWELGEVQSLWSGYGSILRYGLEGADQPSVIVKHIAPPTAAKHPRGWNTNHSHARKLKSYQVESAWYQTYAEQCDPRCRVPKCLAIAQEGEEVLLILEDLDATGFPERRGMVTSVELQACLGWLAQFHATFLGCPGEGLWECGTYWHLETRPDELEQLKSEDPALWKVADAIDAKLKQSAFQTLVHGDAKLANFCFSPDGTSVAAVDFQYVGRGCGMKDVAYFIGSCLQEEACGKLAPGLLDLYFEALRAALAERSSEVDAEALEADWRALYPIAWTDFHRFLKGWSPGHWKIHSYSEQLARAVIVQIEAEQS